MALVLLIYDSVLLGESNMGSITLAQIFEYVTHISLKVKRKAIGTRV